VQQSKKKKEKRQMSREKGLRAGLRNKHYIAFLLVFPLLSLHKENP
jgi:hypothetical protein